MGCTANFSTPLPGGYITYVKTYLEYFLLGFLFILLLLLNMFSGSAPDDDEDKHGDIFLLLSPGAPGLG